MEIQDIRNMFPELAEKVYGRPLVYFDNAATALRPRPVISKWLEMSEKYNANIHRAVHHTAVVATEEFENARDRVREFINAGRREEIIFTSGTTASINLVASAFGDAFIHEGDEVIVTEAEHHSDIVPWQLMCEKKGAELKVLTVDDDGYLNVAELESLCTDRVKIMAVTHISNVLGIINPIKEIVRICHSHGIPVLVDGAQGIVHGKVDVRDLDCDFYAFSGHKMYAATGTGVLYGKLKWLEQMPPYMGGGEMIETVRFSGTTYAAPPRRFEAGTQNIAGIPTLVPAISVIETLNENKDYEAVKEYLMEKLSDDDRIRLFGVPRRTEDKIPLFSFAVNGIHHEDLALLLDKMGVAVRSGQMCAEPLMDRFGVTGMLRASLLPYNTMEEAEYFVESLGKAIKMLS